MQLRPAPSVVSNLVNFVLAYFPRCKLLRNILCIGSAVNLVASANRSLLIAQERLWHALHAMTNSNITSAPTLMRVDHECVRRPLFRSLRRQNWLSLAGHLKGGKVKAMFANLHMSDVDLANYRRI
jgi:hypothetical protein